VTSPSRQAVRYAYDPVGNRLSMTEPTGTVNVRPTTCGDELLTAGGTTFTYDGNGNQLTKTAAAVTLTYGVGRTEPPAIEVSGAECEHAISIPTGMGTGSASRRPRGTYAYRMMTKAASARRVEAKAVPRREQSTMRGLFADLSASATGLQSFYQSDGLGSVATVTTRPARESSYAYGIRGGPQVGTIRWGPRTNSQRSQAEAVDPNTGLVFLRARFYDRVLGDSSRVIQLQDHCMTGSAYLYTLGNPSRLIDPNGHGPFDFYSELFDFASAADGMRQQRQDALNCIMNDPSCDVDAAARTYYGVERQAHSRPQAWP